LSSSVIQGESIKKSARLLILGWNKSS